VTSNIPLAPGFYARPLSPSEFTMENRKPTVHAELAPVELVRVYGEWDCPKSYGEFWDVQSAIDFINLHFKV
jgi:hypothetical protein